MNLSLEYIAGFFDGEGCVCVPRTRGYLHVNIANKHRGVLEGIQKQFGGCLRETHTGVYTLFMATRGAERFLVALLPFLVVKREVAELGIEVSQMPKGTGLSQEKLALIDRIAEINRRTPRGMGCKEPVQ